MPYGDFARDKRIKRVLSIRLFQDVNIEPRYLAGLTMLLQKPSNEERGFRPISLIKVLCVHLYNFFSLYPFFLLSGNWR